MMESGVPACHTCGGEVGLDVHGEPFVACRECGFPVCKACVDHEVSEGRKSCLRCAAPFVIGDVLSRCSCSIQFVLGDDRAGINVFVLASMTHWCIQFNGVRSGFKLIGHCCRKFKSIRLICAVLAMILFRAVEAEILKSAASSPLMF
ncbi:hypothetical protein MLD38_016717 [Melastoma candidum]|uniref:Uncharacterized protein n=1 Tax=Melastoma candidum TaxID=119954 RepID=A0ACB9QPH5_9MYRT|nr:hypothetical protein MLD38_016717 [Melastoma candidum]